MQLFNSFLLVKTRHRLLKQEDFRYVFYAKNGYHFKKECFFRCFIIQMANRTSLVNLQCKNLPRKKDSSFSNRGKTLEDEINETNTYYLNQQIAIIHKKPVPVQIVKVEYPSRSAAVIREAYFRTPSTTDYNGVWNGYYIDFEAKETESKTSFPLKTSTFIK